MSSLLHLDSSAAGSRGSVSGRLTALFADTWKGGTARPDTGTGTWRPIRCHR